MLSWADLASAAGGPDDAADFGDVHPLLVPLVMNSHTQWLIVYSAILRGITNLDDRVFMGRHVLATGGATWP